ncbi:HD-GYP domain-containing protein [Oceanospirillum beijerinckii]|uniref:HD-GYP domain-containing protein n=1 Tax=Oceanospirillum beijerinckii TaxID=64976 RepID=UPI000486FDE3|nr:HD domain-containing phosphohydrolase [Oceanospirillum beijerinckii]
MLMKEFEFSAINSQDIELDKPVPWPVYDEFGKLLMAKGSIIRTERQREILLRVGLYAREEPEEEKEDDWLKPVSFNRPINPFAEFDDLCLRLSELFLYIEKKETPPEGAVYKRTMGIVTYLQGLVAHNMDAMIGAVHLMDNFPYHVLHPIQMGILCEVIASRLKIKQEKRLSMLAAALTSNISMNGYQVKLHQQRKPLTEQQREVIEKHPDVSAAILASSGIGDNDWLQLVRSHHERPSGEGYPRRLSAKTLPIEAKIIALADVYCAMVTPRPYREAVSHKETLRELFVQRGLSVDEKLTSLFVHELGLYPPGVYVKLQNGELAVVVGRTESPKEPLVASVRKPDGNVFLNPRRRNTEQDEFSIRSTCSVSDKVSVNPAMLWGIQALRVEKKRLNR